MKKTILAIETSCDETGIALVEALGSSSAPKFKVLKNLVSSQIKVHRPFGGVVPGLAKREHIKNLPLLFKKLHATHYKLLTNADLIAVTVGPGLEPALWTGINFAKEFRKSLMSADKNLRKSAPELIGVNHLEGHLYSFLLPQQKKTAISKSKFLISKQTQNPKSKNLEIRISDLEFPAVALLVSGGHTILLKMDSLTKWKKLGETKDDAAGEAFDKVARMLNLPYPGGPEIEKIAHYGSSTSIDFPRPMLNQKNYDFSFSGLKTAVLYYLKNSADLRGLNAEQRGKFLRKSALSPRLRRGFGGQVRKSALAADIAASFQQAAIDVLVAKTIRAAKEYKARSVILCGGVAANKSLRNEMKKTAVKSKMDFFVPDMEYNNDNAAMIAAAAYMGLSHRKKYKIEAAGDLNI